MLDALYPPLPTRVVVDVAPVYSALLSLVSVADARESPGISKWAVQTREALCQEEWEQHRLLATWIGIEPLSNVIQAPEALDSFPAYIQALAAQDATSLRDDLLYWMMTRPSSLLLYKPSPPPVDDPLSLLESEHAFFSFFGLHCKGEEEIESLQHLYTYLIDPPSLQFLLTSYLDHFWQEHLREEWARVLPELEEAVTAFSKIDTTGMSHFEVIETITHRNLRGVCRAEVLSTYDTLRFIPSFHCGPYILRFSDGQELRIVFNAHHLLDVARRGEGADQTYLLDRLKALGDETRLEIIRLLKAQGELGTQQIIDRLGLSKSAASRHLRQLCANSIVELRMDEDGIRKYYRLDPSFRREMHTMVDRLLG
jgi:ArsR family transcriptional regulator